jgi:hypothetical protein
MKKAINFLMMNGIKCDKKGNIKSELPIGLKGIYINDIIEEITCTCYYCYTIVNNKLTKIDA